MLGLLLSSIAILINIKSVTALVCVPGNYLFVIVSEIQGQLYSIETCFPCDSGTYRDNSGATQKSDCLKCRKGRYAFAGSSTCLSCEPGRYGDAEGQASCKACSSGRASSSSGASSSIVCSECDPGRFSNGEGLTACYKCEPGRFSTASGASNPGTCQECNAGRFSSRDLGSTQCDECPAGRYLLVSGASTRALCEPCSAGKFQSETAATICADCESGRISAYGSTACAPCDPGRFSPSAGRADCAGCNPGRYSTAVGASSSDTCVPCGAGRASATVGASLAEACFNCRAGSFSSEGAWACSDCLAGSFSGINPSGSCSQCEPGRFSNGNGFTTCYKCEAGRFSTASGASDPGTCQECNAGRFSDRDGSTVCDDCPPGRYLPKSAASTWALCEPCSAGKFQSGTAATICADCESGRISAYGSTACAPCDPGRFSPNEGASSCIECDLGKFSSQIAANSATSCINCDPGSYSFAVGASSADACTSCDAGYFSPYAGAIFPSSCEPCAPGKIASTAKASECMQCNPGRMALPGAKACVPCDPGRFSADGGAECAGCNPGRYSTAVGASSSDTCVPCGAGRASAAVGASLAEACFNCRAGSFSLEGASACSDCLAGRFSSVVALVSGDMCEDCEAGRWSVAGAVSCTKCDANFFSNKTGASSVMECMPCPPPNRFSNEGSSSIDDCTEAPAGFQCPLGSWCVGDQITACEKGSFSDREYARSAEACVPCPPGSFAELPGQVACKICNHGTRSNETGRSRPCDTCQQGEFCPPGSLKPLLLQGNEHFFRAASFEPLLGVPSLLRQQSTLDILLEMSPFWALLGAAVLAALVFLTLTKLGLVSQSFIFSLDAMANAHKVRRWSSPVNRPTMLGVVSTFFLVAGCVAAAFYLFAANHKIEESILISRAEFHGAGAPLSNIRITVSDPFFGGASRDPVSGALIQDLGGVGRPCLAFGSPETAGFDGQSSNTSTCGSLEFECKSCEVSLINQVGIAVPFSTQLLQVTITTAWPQSPNAVATISFPVTTARAVPSLDNSNPNNPNNQLSPPLEPLDPAAVLQGLVRYQFSVQEVVVIDRVNGLARTGLRVYQDQSQSLPTSPIAGGSGSGSASTTLTHSVDSKTVTWQLLLQLHRLEEPSQITYYQPLEFSQLIFTILSTISAIVAASQLCFKHGEAVFGWCASRLSTCKLTARQKSLKAPLLPAFHAGRERRTMEMAPMESEEQPMHYSSLPAESLEPRVSEDRTTQRANETASSTSDAEQSPSSHLFPSSSKGTFTPFPPEATRQPRSKSDAFEGQGFSI